MRFNFTEIGGFRQESQHNGWVKPSSQLREIIKTDDLFLAGFKNISVLLYIAVETEFIKPYQLSRFMRSSWRRSRLVGLPSGYAALMRLAWSSCFCASRSAAVFMSSS